MHVGSTRVVEYVSIGVHQGSGYGTRKEEGDGVLNFVLVYDLIIGNTIFRKSLSSSDL
jgi:hypothetical protein